MTRDYVIKFFNSLLGKVDKVYYKEAEKNVMNFINELDKTYKYKTR